DSHRDPLCMWRDETLDGRAHFSADDRHVESAEVELTCSARAPQWNAQPENRTVIRARRREAPRVDFEASRHGRAQEPAVREATTGLHAVSHGGRTQAILTEP